MHCYICKQLSRFFALLFLSLNLLANYYLKSIKQKFKFNNKDTKVVILGWSLGGLISMEIACILESEGYTNIQVFLLDTVVRDVELKQLYDKLDKDFLKEEINKKYDISYAEKLINNIDVESVIVSESITNKLNYTKITLYKAMKQDEFEGFKVANEHLKQLKNNNIARLLYQESQLRVINVYEASHSTIIAEIVKSDSYITELYEPIYF